MRYRPKKVRTPASFFVLADLWLDTQGRVASATYAQYATAVRFWKILLGNLPIEEIDHKMLAVKVGRHQWKSAKQHNNYMIALRGIFALEYHGALHYMNPVAGIDNMAVVKALPDPFTAAERDTILMHMRKRFDPWVEAYFRWQFYTGMRPEETIALRWSDIDESRGTIRVQRVRTYNGVDRIGSKTHSMRDVDIVAPAEEALLTMGSCGGDGHIFLNPLTSAEWRSERVQRDAFWKPTIKALGIRFRRQYNTRHTYATIALMGGVPLPYVAAQLGHSVAMMLDRYARWTPANDTGDARKILMAAMSKENSNA